MTNIELWKQVRDAIEGEYHSRLAKKFPKAGVTDADKELIKDWSQPIIEALIPILDPYSAAKDRETGGLSAENKRLREGLEEILRSQEYEGFLLVSPALVENLLKTT